jgi:hypothetical protein
LVRAHIYAPVLPLLITVAAVTTAAIVLRERDAQTNGSATRVTDVKYREANGFTDGKPADVVVAGRG